MIVRPVECNLRASVVNPCKVVLAGGMVLLNESALATTNVSFAPPSVATVDQQSKTRVRAKRHLDAAKSAKKDEFYTQYADVEREIELYVKYCPDTFRDKVVLLPCDDPHKSNFAKYFADNFVRFGILRLICTSYNRNGAGRVLRVERSDAQSGVVRLSKMKCERLLGNGDFRSEEITAIRDGADIIVTNPPFSLFRNFFTWLIESKKKFLVIGNVNCISYKEVYPYIMNNQVWLGHGIGRWISGFIVPDDYDLYGTETSLDADGNHVISSNNCLWLTNLDHGRRHEPLKLMTMQENLEHSRHKDVRGVGYRKYDNCDAIEVPHSDSIPSDYEGLMGVPITFLDKYCPEQFELVRFRKGDDGKDLRIDGKPPYFRILIRRRDNNK